jgi:hypothetical protein
MGYAFNPTKKDGRKIALENELKVLKAVRHFGHLRRHEIAMAVWPTTSKDSSYIMASRTVSRMLQKGLLLDKPNSLGGTSLVITTKGATLLKNHGLSTTEGYDLALRGAHLNHRYLGTCYLLEKAKRGDDIYGEYAIMRGWAPLSRDQARDRYGKIPDGLIMSSGEIHGMSADVKVLDWVEVEVGYKPYAEVEPILNLLKMSPYMNESGTLILGKLIFAYDSQYPHDRRLLSYLRRFLSANPELDGEAVLKEVVLARCYVDLPLVWRGVEEASVWDLLNVNQVEEFNEDEDE